MDWTLLDIEPTTDKSAITKAYRARLTITNPEDDPEGFKALRAAYEEALALADAPEEEEPADMSPLGQWLTRVVATYRDFPARINVDAWKELLQDDQVQGLDTRADAEAALIGFLMQNYYLPQAVWQVLNDTFDWPARADELREALNPDFVTYVMLNGATNEETLPFDLFTPGRDAAAVDAYVKLFIQARHTDDPRDEEDLLRQLAELPESHPYGICQQQLNRVALAGVAIALAVDSADEEATQAARQVRTQALEEAVANTRELVAAYPADIHLKVELATMLMHNGQFDQAEALADAVITAQPTIFVAWRILADAQEQQEKLADAVETLNNAMDYTDGNMRLLADLNEQRTALNDRLIVTYTQQLAEDPQNTDTRFALAWCYLQNSHLEEAAEQAAGLAVEQPDPFSYYNLMACIANGLQNSAEEEGHLTELVRVVEGLQPDGTRKTARRIRRLGEVILRLANAQRNLGQDEEAAQTVARAITVDPTNGEVLTFATQLMCEMENLPQAATYADMLTKVANRSYHGFLLKAIINYQLGNDGVAYAAINDAIDLDPTDLEEYHVKLLLLMRNDLFDQAAELIGFLQENGIDDDLTMRWCEARLLEERDDDEDAALEAYRTLQPEVEAAGKMMPLNWAPEFFYRLTCLTASAQDKTENYDRAPLLALLETGLAADPDDRSCLDYKAWLLKKEGRTQEAIDLYRKLVAMPHRGTGPEEALAQLYSADLETFAPEALSVYEQLIEDDPENGDLEFYAGMADYCMGRWAEAEAHFRAEQAKAPDDVDGYLRMAYVYLAMGRTEDALAQALRGVKIARTWDKGRSNNLFSPAIITLSRLGRVDEALALCRECIDLNPGSIHQRMRTMADILARAGRVAEVAKLLKEWQKVPDYNHAQWTFCHQRNLIAQQKFGEARIGFKMGDEANMVLEDQEWIGSILDMQSGHLNSALNRTENALATKRQGNQHDLDLLLDHLALAFWAYGREDKARQLAAEVLERTEAEITKYQAQRRTIFLTRRTVALAILGRVDEARELVETAKRLPLCEWCCYGVCKDALVFEGRIAIITEDWARAQAAIDYGRATWPGEEDFEYNAALLAAVKKRKGVQ